MANKIYKMFRGRFRDAWYQLSDEEQNDLMTKIDTNMQKLGVNRIIACDTSWHSEYWTYFGMEVYPDMDAVLAHAAFLNEINWFRYQEVKIMLGTEWQLSSLSHSPSPSVSNCPLPSQKSQASPEPSPSVSTCSIF